MMWERELINETASETQADEWNDLVASVQEELEVWWQHTTTAELVEELCAA
ncbi:MAG: hypothetical protein H7Z42_21750 [Roseiflexaceae bacterium]|nr:hypothetical protein [Roseiflexaceae bacterium]